MVRASLVSAILGYLLMAGLSRAQSSYTHLSGLVRDPSEGAVPGATITVVNEETGFRRLTRSRSDGSYVLVSLEPGLYKITARRAGFRTLIRLGVRLDLGQLVRVDFTLTIGSVQESITVEGAPATFRTEDASIGTLIGREQIERLPLNGHNLLSLL